MHITSRFVDHLLSLAAPSMQRPVRMPITLPGPVRAKCPGTRSPMSVREL